MTAMGGHAREGHSNGGHSREGQTFAGESGFVKYANFVKLPHTLFALPFALAGVVLASYVSPITIREVVLAIVAFTAARFVAMGFNRVVDRHIDSVNPRTQMREIPAGKITVREAYTSILVASAIFLGAAYLLNPICFMLSPVALAWICFYSYTKRFTSLAHIVLGLSLAIAPVGGYLAVAGGWSSPWWLLCAIAVGVATWVAGFDIFYALQDIDFDKSLKLHSIPVALGVGGALNVARLLHTITVVSLGAVGYAAGLGVIYWIGMAVVAGVLFYEHSLVKSGDLSRLDAAFFSMNGIISITYFSFVLAERLFVLI